MFVGAVRITLAARLPPDWQRAVTLAGLDVFDPAATSLTVVCCILLPATASDTRLQEMTFWSMSNAAGLAATAHISACSLATAHDEHFQCLQNMHISEHTI